MRTTVTISQNLNCSIFEVMAQEIDDVIMLINFYLRIGDEAPQSTDQVKSDTEKEIKVTSATATGGWW
ncbi:MAG: hypothetical protein MJZ20_08370 [Bacteroidaceae bacterium]|nr:hypothetical protein [Bacteroidaceae bacterium]